MPKSLHAICGIFNLHIRIEQLRIARHDLTYSASGFNGALELFNKLLSDHFY